MWNPLDFIKNLLCHIWTIFLDILGAGYFGFGLAGFRGAVNSVIYVTRRRCGKRPGDGLPLPSRFSCEGVTMPCFLHMDNQMWQEAVDR